jgi:adenylyltransferase/sulfurtransferase
MNRAHGDRYSRQILFAPIGPEGQERIQQATVCIVGCGALGSFQAEAIARAGIGKLRLIDRDTVDFTNLQRQWLYDEADAEEEKPKAVAAEQRLRRLNSTFEIEAVVADVTGVNSEELIGSCDVLLDGTDNFETRFLLNDVSVKTGTPWIYGAAVGSYGIVIPIDPTRGPCFRCIYPEGPAGVHPTCDLAGVLSSTTASVAARQVAAALRFLVGWPEFRSTIYTVDVWNGTGQTVDAGPRDPLCSTCVQREFRYLNGATRTPVSLCGRNAVQLHSQGRRVDLRELASRLQGLGEVRVNDFALRLHMAKYDLTVFPDGRAIVRGTTEVPLARSLYARLVGS